MSLVTALLIVGAMQIFTVGCMVISEIVNRKRERRIKQMFHEQKLFLEACSEEHERRLHRLMMFLNR